MATAHNNGPGSHKRHSVTKVKPLERDVVVGKTVVIKGRTFPTGRRSVAVKVGGKTMQTRANATGRFRVEFTPRSTGHYGVRAFAKRNRVSTGSKDSGPRVTAYRHAQASWYGPGLYGNRTACGQTLTSSTRGVANKSLPCGTKLTLRYHGREVNVRVIDRGPYVGDREFDLTEATRNDLGFGSTGAVLTTK